MVPAAFISFKDWCFLKWKGLSVSKKEKQYIDNIWYEELL